jgi:hypothetical protein
MALARAISLGQSQKSIGTTTTKLTGRRNSMERNIKCFADVTEWIDTDYYNDSIGLSERIIEDINISIKKLLNKACDEGIEIESSHVFMKRDLIKGETNIRFYVTMAGMVNE